MHTYESRGWGNLFIWFGGTLNKSFQGPIICHPLCPTTTSLLLDPIAIKPVSIFLSFCVGPGKLLFFQISSSIFSCSVFLYKVFGVTPHLEWERQPGWPGTPPLPPSAYPAVFQLASPSTILVGYQEITVCCCCPTPSTTAAASVVGAAAADDAAQPPPPLLASKYKHRLPALNSCQQ